MTDKPLDFVAVDGDELKPSMAGVEAFPCRQNRKAVAAMLCGDFCAWWKRNDGMGLFQATEPQSRGAAFPVPSDCRLTRSVVAADAQTFGQKAVLARSATDTGFFPAGNQGVGRGMSCVNSAYFAPTTCASFGVFVPLRGA